MKADADFRRLEERLGTASPLWKLEGANEILHLYPARGASEARIRIPLSPEQTQRIRALTGVTAMLILEVRLFGRPVKMHLVGQKSGLHEWTGIAALLSNPVAIAENSLNALTLAEEIVTEVNGIVVMLDKKGTIYRFNRVAEEYTGIREGDVIGQNAQDLFMSVKEGEDSRRNIEKFFELGRPLDVNRLIETKSGSKVFRFRNRFVRGVSKAETEFILCSGVEIDLARTHSENLRKEWRRINDTIETARATARQLSALLMLASSESGSLQALPPLAVQDLVSLASDLSEKLRADLTAAGDRSG